MDEVQGRQFGLPMRLAPSRQASLLGALFMVVWLGMLVFISSKMLPDVIENLEDFRDNPTVILFIAVPLFMFCAGVPMFALFATRLLPGSPLDYLSIREDGVVRRLTWKVKEAKWQEIHQFGCIERTRKTKNGSRKYWLIMAERAESTARDPDRRAKEALLSFDSGGFAPAFSENEEFAVQLTQWLNGLLSTIRAGRLSGPILMPPFLAGAIRICAGPRVEDRVGASREIGRPTQGKTAPAAPRKSVIER